VAGGVLLARFPGHVGTIRESPEFTWVGGYNLPFGPFGPLKGALPIETFPFLIRHYSRATLRGKLGGLLKLLTRV